MAVDDDEIKKRLQFKEVNETQKRSSSAVKYGFIHFGWFIVGAAQVRDNLSAPTKMYHHQIIMCHRLDSRPELVTGQNIRTESLVCHFTVIMVAKVKSHLRTITLENY